MTPDEAEAMLRFVNTASELGDLADAERPHVLVAVWPGGCGPALGPFPDLFAAEAAKVVWEQQLNDDDPEHVGVEVMPLFPNGT